MSEEKVGRAGDPDLSHLFLVDEFDGGVAELFANQVDKFVPIWESVSGPAIERQVRIVVVSFVVAGGVGVIGVLVL